MKALLFGLGVGMALQAWRNFPPDGPLQTDSAMWVSIGAAVCAFLVGYWRRRPASAVAVASAEATATASNETTVQVYVAAPGEGAQPAGGLRVPDAVEWRGSERLAVTEQDLDGMELSELLELDSEPEATT